MRGNCGNPGKVFRLIDNYLYTSHRRSSLEEVIESVQLRRSLFVPRLSCNLRPRKGSTTRLLFISRDLQKNKIINLLLSWRCTHSELYIDRRLVELLLARQWRIVRHSIHWHVLAVASIEARRRPTATGMATRRVSHVLVVLVDMDISALYLRYLDRCVDGWHLFPRQQFLMLLFLWSNPLHSAYVRDNGSAEVVDGAVCQEQRLEEIPGLPPHQFWSRRFM